MNPFCKDEDSIQLKIVLNKVRIIPEIVSSNTELTNQDVTITITAETSETQTIEYRIADYPKDEEEDVTNVTWTTYTEPFELGENKIIYAHVLDGTEALEEGSLIVDNIDKENPTIIGNIDEDDNEKLKLTFADEGVAGLDKYQYVILDHLLEEEETLEYGEEIEFNNENTESKISLNVGDNYVYVKVFDKAGNVKEEVLGNYFILGGNFNVEIEVVSDLGDIISNMELSMEEITETTNEEGKVAFELAKKASDTFTYSIGADISEEYEEIENLDFDITFDDRGNITNVNVENENLELIEKDEDSISLRLTLNSVAQEDLYLISTVYTIDDIYCDRVSPDTTIKDFASKIQTNGTKKVFDKNGNELDIEDESKLVGTSFKVRAERGEEFIEKEVVVVGDYNGDGIVNILDVGSINRYSLGLIPFSETRQRVGDATGDGIVNILDVGRINRYSLGLLPKLITK